LFAAVTGVVVYGMFSIEYSMWSVSLMLAAGGLGYVMSILRYPSVPLILGLVLGPLLELGIRRTLITSRGDFGVFLDRPIALVVLSVTILILLMPVFIRLFKSRFPVAQTAPE
jgi:putative tricarboxylic transport membrane protein